MGTRNRFSNGFSTGIPADADAPLHDVELVNEFGEPILHVHSRRPDDVLSIDEECQCECVQVYVIHFRRVASRRLCFPAFRNPKSNCVADRFAATKSKQFPACWDHNATVDATLSCFTPEGRRQRNCMQFSYSVNALVVACGGEFADVDSCGTFLEVHKTNGSPYDDESVPLSTTKVVTPVTNGMTTTTIPLTYSGDSSRVLCSYEESEIGVNSMVRVKDNTAECCCPPWLSAIRTSKVGAYLCPKRRSGEGGPFAPSLQSLDEEFVDDLHQQDFPWCPQAESDTDVLMCTQERPMSDELPQNVAGKYLMRRCRDVEPTEDGKLESQDLSGKYDRACPLLGDVFNASCAAPNSPGQCVGKDHRFSFRNEIGKVVKVVDVPDNKGGDTSHQAFEVTFNDNRTSYVFSSDELHHLRPEANYEVWFVQRYRYEKIVRKRKSFRVTWPRCTYDAVNERFFPWAMIDSNANPIRQR